MTNVLATPEKKALKAELFAAAEAALKNQGWSVERIPKIGKSSVRRITKGGVSKIATIRTTQNTWFAFPRLEKDQGWRTLDDVEVVIPVSVDDAHNPKFAKVHMIDGDEMRSRFDRAYAARKKAGHSIPVGRGVWISLYDPESNDPVTYVGAGSGLKFPPIANIPLKSVDGGEFSPEEIIDPKPALTNEEPLSISEAKRRLAITFNVDPSNIRITVEG